MLRTHEATFEEIVVDGYMRPELFEVEILCDITPGQRQTWDEPGFDSELEIVEVKVMQIITDTETVDRVEDSHFWELDGIMTTWAKENCNTDEILADISEYEVDD